MEREIGVTTSRGVIIGTSYLRQIPEGMSHLYIFTIPSRYENNKISLTRDMIYKAIVAKGFDSATVGRLSSIALPNSISTKVVDKFSISLACLRQLVKKQKIEKKPGGLK